LAPFVDAYRHELKGRGYTARSVVSQLRQVSRFSLWLEARGPGVSAVGGGLIEDFLGWQREGGRHRAEWSRPGLACLVDVPAVLDRSVRAGKLGAGPKLLEEAPGAICWPSAVSEVQGAI
jgi:hypothetical protein